MLTPEQYLEIERKAEYKSEYHGGEMFAMAGAGSSHNQIAMHAGTLLDLQFRGRPCEVFGSDQRVKVSQTGLYAYPDVTAICGKPRLEDDELDTLLNPVLIMEILSPSTEAFDRGRKFEHYRTINLLPSSARCASPISTTRPACSNRKQPILVSELCLRNRRRS